MISVRPASQLFIYGKDYNVVIFSDTRNTINVKLCMMIVLIKLYSLIPLYVTGAAFPGDSSVKQFEMKI